MDRVLHRHQEGYPEAFEALESPPNQVWVRGALDDRGPRVAIVGTRRCSERGRRLAEQLAEGLARAGVLVISGGALGIDGAAHTGALLGAGRTWVVLPTPLARPAPPRNRALFERVLAGGGAWLTEVEEEAGKHTFFMRNRLVAALAHLVVVVEAKLESGTRHTVDFARALGRPVAAFPWAVGEAYGEGCLAWIQQGAHLVTGPQDVLGLLDKIGAPARRPEATGPLADPVLAALGPQGAAPDALAAQLGWPVGQVLVHLTRLELRGQVKVGPGGCFVGVAVPGR